MDLTAFQDDETLPLRIQKINENGDLKRLQMKMMQSFTMSLNNKISSFVTQYIYD